MQNTESPQLPEEQKFDSLEDRMLYYRRQTDYRLKHQSYVLVMLDGKNFSQKVKKRFKRPFDNEFITLMNKTAAHVCSEVQGTKFAYVQSDEISILITDFETPETSAYFDFRLCKMLSVIASTATAYFNRLVAKKILSAHFPEEALDNEPLYEFDAKAWTVPSANDAFAWFLYRQNDCKRNSKQQAAQTYLSHKELLGKHTDEQIALLKEKKGIDWNTDFNDGEKFGRFIIKTTREATREFNGKTVTYERSVWEPIYAMELSTEEGRDAFNKLELIPAKQEKYISKRANVLDVLKSEYEDVLEKQKQLMLQIASLETACQIFDVEIPLETEEKLSDYYSTLALMHTKIENDKNEFKKLLDAEIQHGK